MRRIALLLAALPLPIFTDLPLPKWQTTVAVHVDQPIGKPATVSHLRNYGLGDGCAMCVGGHLVNMHRITTRELDALAYRTWASHHAKLHDAMGTPQQSGCAGGVCPTRSTGPIRTLFGRWR